MPLHRDEKRIYCAIDMKSFYSSVECVALGRDPLTTNLVVADKSRTDKTICLAVSPSLKAVGVKGRPRLFEVVQQVRLVNGRRRLNAPNRRLVGESDDATELAAHPELALSYIIAPPRMARYVECSTEVYKTYLKFVSAEDIKVYSIDEVFIDITQYIRLYGMTAEELVRAMIKDVLERTGVTATAGIGTNLYLAKIAMDVTAKHAEPDENGVRMAMLDERSYREKLWSHRPLTDFWRVGRGYARKLEANGLYTMGDVARCSIGKPTDYHNEAFLYKLFGKNAELLIDHAWGYEPCTMEEIKRYTPEAKSVGAGQVLQRPYKYDETRIIVREMAEELSLDLFEKNLVTDKLVLTIGYDADNVKKLGYAGQTKIDVYGREIPVHAHGTENLKSRTSSTQIIVEAMTRLFERIVNPSLLTRRVTMAAENVIKVDDKSHPQYEEINLFEDAAEAQKKREADEKAEKLQRAVLALKKRYGKDAILRGADLTDGATAKLRHHQIGGHKA